MLEHLVLYPDGGICNRMRAIASAKRLCSQTGARCSIAWSWGDYGRVFDDNTDWMPFDLAYYTVRSGYHLIRHLFAREGGNRHNHRVPITTFPRIAVRSLYVFGAAEEPVIKLPQVWPWFPQPHSEVQQRVKAFRSSHLPAKVVGIHMRRTDNRRAILRSPDKAFLDEADLLIQEGFEIFLATDNVATLNMMRHRYGAKLHFRPKTSERTIRWPRRDFVLEDLLDDMIDLWLLAACDHVIGSAGSTYSEVAIALNGAARSRVVEHVLLSAQGTPMTVNFKLS
jgi:hypothetical protein